ncbi:heptaprenylglyceryl phosphate synthase [Caldibacillus lycopersici]|uniref:Heptaprenylglyceryl phosphate synthase n=1 Tax=Perspicuibacillus lycopersici TaxID=1325689 RepID=A0AAE3LN53_9BACI|nr:heptaprenylglyceryl phosphate synthase [Perspicuibacillus lycopersici]MCU9614305.1 heptaprenylglyceryl phosphate synthase [Perspicuibacillus lycopersici]
MYDFREWKHIFKLDPNKEIKDEALEQICESGTDAIMIGGTDGVTLEKVINLMARVRRYPLPCVLEISTIDSITPGFDLYFIPSVLNSSSRDWILGQHHLAVKEFGHWINWQEMIVEGYCILNENSKVAQLTNAMTKLDAEDVAAYAQMAEKMFHLPILYIEYSGTYGNPEIVKSAKNHLENTILFYGGGIDSVAKACEMANYADVVVVGNVIYENISEALKTVQAVKATVGND